MKFLFALSLLATTAFAEDWGAYQIVSVSAPEFVLEAVSGTKEGDAVSVNKPSNAANQKWIIQPKGDGWFWLMPASHPGLALTVANGEKKPGSKITIEKDTKSDAQLWSLTKQDNGSHAIEPKHAPGMGLDHLGGKKEVGAKVDLWQHRKGDSHLQWFVRPLAGSGIVEAKKVAVPTYIPPPHQARGHPSRPHRDLHLQHEQDLPRHRARSHGVHPGAVRRLQASVRLREDRWLQPAREDHDGATHRDQRNAGDHRCFCEAGLAASADEGHAGSAQSLL
jgi:hypothetical protein